MLRRTVALAMATMLVLVLAVAGCGSDGGSEAQVPSSTVESAEPTTSLATTTSSSTTTTTTTEPPLREFEPLYADPNLSIEEQVEAAYLFHWEVLLDAYRTGRTDHLPLVYGEEMVEFRTDEIGRLVADGQRVEGEVEHDMSIIVVDSHNVSVVDAYTNGLVRVDTTSGERLGDPSGEQVGYSFEMEKRGNRWLVTHVVRYHLSS